jgi:RND family efflux transporter MFP subunit
MICAAVRATRRPAGPVTRLSRAGGIGLLAAATVLTACGKQNAYQPPPPAEVGVSHPVQRVVIPYIEATGTTAPYNQIDLQARVEGFLTRIGYADGAAVKLGDTLFVIEQAPYQAKYQQAQAALASAQAALLQSSTEYSRQYTLGKTNVAAQSTIDQAKAKRDADAANVQTQQAGLVLAGINLGYTNVVASFDGVATAHLVSVGQLVGVTGPTTLASLVQIDPIYVNFTIPELEVQRIRAGMAKAGLTLAELGTIHVQVGLPNESGFPHEGVLDYVAPQVDTGTGTLAVRAVFQNKQHALLPGYFVRVRIPRARGNTPSLLVPDVAIGTGQGGNYVLVVGKDDVVEQRAVSTGQLDGALRVIESGLRADDDVVVQGLARAIPGQKVAPQTAGGA